MTEAECVYTIEMLWQKMRNANGNSDVTLKCSLRIDNLVSFLFWKHGKWFRDYTDKEIQDLIAEHLLLGE